MRTGMPLSQGANLPIYSSRLDTASQVNADCGNPMLEDVDYSNPVAVGCARDAILRMRLWDGVVEMAVEAGSEIEAREAIADIVLCQKAVTWQRDNPTRQPVAELSEGHLQAAQVRLFRLLSVDGVNAMTARYRMLPDGIGYTPATGYAEADEMLATVVSESVVKAVLEGPDRACCAAQTLAGHAEAWRLSRRSYATALHWDIAGLVHQIDTDFRQAALAQETAAAAWEAAARPEDAAVTYEKASENWSQAEAQREAAQACEKAAVAWATAGESGQAGRVWEEVAKIWYFGSESAMAAQANERAAEAYLDAGETRLAVNALVMAAASWEGARMPVQAARTWTKAMQRAGEDTVLAERVLAKASSLFHVDQASEGNWTD